MPKNFVYLRHVDPSIEQDIRYAGADNFVGRPLPGYGAGECLLRREAATALKQIQAELAITRLALKVYDCYRPARASRAMVEWALAHGSDGPSKRFFPRTERINLLAGYIGSASRHATGLAVDLTLIRRGDAAAPPFDREARYGPCNGPPAKRAPDNSVDMGTGYDCFDRDSHTASPSVGAGPRRWRSILVAAMAKHGFRNYHREWWHFVYVRAPTPARRDFPICDSAARACGP